MTWCRGADINVQDSKERHCWEMGDAKTRGFLISRRDASEPTEEEEEEDVEKQTIPRTVLPRTVPQPREVEDAETGGTTVEGAPTAAQCRNRSRDN